LNISSRIFQDYKYPALNSFHKPPSYWLEKFGFTDSVVVYIWTHSYRTGGKSTKNYRWADIYGRNVS